MAPEDYAENRYFAITIPQNSKIKKSVYLQHHRAKPFTQRQSAWLLNLFLECENRGVTFIQLILRINKNHVQLAVC